jgi:fatty-acyl-CoA synthase
MQVAPLSVGRLLRYGATVHAPSTVATWTGDATTGARRETFAEAGARMAQLAHALRGLGIDGDQRVGTFMFNNAEHVEAYFAVPAMGAVLHTVNVRLFPEQMAYVVNHAEDEVVVVDAFLAPAFGKLLPHLKTVRHVLVAGPGADPSAIDLSGVDGVEVHAYEELLAAQPTTYDWPEVDELDAAAVCYTSGTTGNPKGVVYSHRSIWLHSMQVCMKEGFALDDHERVLAVVPQFHAMAWGLVYAAYMSGASLLLPDRFLQAEPLATMIAAERPTFAAAVPTIWTDLLAYLDANGGDVSSLHEVVIGGSACPPSLLEAYDQRYGVRVVHAWGMTETSPLGSVSRPPATATDDDTVMAYRVTQGRLPASMEARLVGPDGSELAWDGASVGELEVRGPWVAGAYHLDPDPEKFHDGWLRTGDVGCLSADGYLTLTDRSKDVIKSGGEWISSVALENALMAHPAVAEASVVGVPDERWGERPLATVVLREGKSASFEELRAHLAGSFASWQLPERWVVIDALPKTSVGKFDKKVLRQRYADGELEVTTLG